MTLEAKAKLQQLALNATVTFDDVVNVFVARHETALHDRRASLQAELKEELAFREALIKQVRKAVEELVINKFKETVIVNYPASAGAENGIYINYTFKVSETGNLAKSPTWKVSMTQELVIENDTNIQFELSYNKRPQTMVTTTGLEVNVPQMFVNEWLDGDKKVAHLKERLGAINQELQSMDRKTRQIKGVLAERKLQAEGLMDALDSPEIDRILRLPA